MGIKCILSCKAMGQRTEINLSDYLMDMSLVDLSKSVYVYENGSYDIFFLCDSYDKNDVECIDVCVNGKQVGSININQDSDTIEGSTCYCNNNNAKQPFLLHYDLVTVSFIVHFKDDSCREFFTDFMLCISKKSEDNINIQKMLQELSTFDDSQVNEWIFSNSNQGTSNSLYEGKWNKHAYRSLNSYIQLLEQIIACYKSNFAYFKVQGKHTIKNLEVLVPCEKVKQISYRSFNWIMQNADQLANVPYSSGIKYQGKCYLPYHIRTDTHVKSRDVYENQIVMSFLYTVLLNAKQIFSEFDKDILNEERVMTKIHGSFPKEYSAPIITIKSLQISFCRILLSKLSRSIDMLQDVYKQYLSLFDVKTSLLTTLPQKTSSFCEINPYTQIFEVIIHWFEYGEYSLEKERLILQVKTLDKLFEYYCLLRLLKLLADNGYKNEAVLKFNYLSADEHYQNEKDIPNTYLLNNGSIAVTLYYQPVISTITFENGLRLYRTTGRRINYYTPDFVLKFKSPDNHEEYVVFDAKFSSRKNIRKDSLPEIIRKYSCETSVAASSNAPKMVWVLQGRVENNEKTIFKYHNSPLSKKYPPIASYGIVSVNTSVELKHQLWNEIRNSVSFLK